MSTKRPIYFSGSGGSSAENPGQEKTSTYKTPTDPRIRDIALMFYVGLVWVNENVPLTDPSALTRFNIRKLWPEADRFFSSGSGVPRGLSLEELWLSTQLYCRSAMTCLLNADQPETDTSRITRLVRLQPSELWQRMLLWYEECDARLTPAPLLTMVYDGSTVAHCINSFFIDLDRLHFHDPWKPTESLLCAEVNSAGVSAIRSGLLNKDGFWSITFEEFAKVVYAVLLPDNFDDLIKLDLRLTDDEQRQATVRQIGLALVNALNQSKSEQSLPAASGKGLSRLECAAMLGALWEVKQAIADWDDLDAYGEQGTPLHLAAERGFVEIVKLLVKYGADPRILNPQGKSAAELALKSGHRTIADLLSQAVV